MDGSRTNLARLRSHPWVQVRDVEMPLADLHRGLLAQLVFQLECLQHLHRIGRDERGLLGQVALQELSLPELVVEVDSFVEVGVPRLSTRAEDLLRLGVDSVLKLEREHPGHNSPSGLAGIT